MIQTRPYSYAKIHTQTLILGKIFSANHVFGAIVKTFCKIILRSFQKKFETMHTSSASIDCIVTKFENQNHFVKNSYENNKFHLHMHRGQNSSPRPLS
jgi:uncharacterized membrane protein